MVSRQTGRCITRSFCQSQQSKIIHFSPFSTVLNTAFYVSSVCAAHMKFVSAWDGLYLSGTLKAIFMDGVLLVISNQIEFSEELTGCCFRVVAWTLKKRGTMTREAQEPSL